MPEKPTYSSTSFITADSDFSIEAAFETLSRRYQTSPVNVEKVDADLKVDFGSWFLTISEVEGSGDLERTPKTPADFDISTCERRVHLHSIDPHPTMDHFNDFLIVAEKITDTFNGVFTRDNSSGRWF